MILSLSAKEREALVLGIVEELHSKSLVLCHSFYKSKYTKISYFFGAIAKLVMPRIANPTCVGSSPTSSSISSFNIVQYNPKYPIKLITL